MHIERQIRNNKSSHIFCGNNMLFKKQKYAFSMTNDIVVMARLDGKCLSQNRLSKLQEQTLKSHWLSAK